VRVKRASTDYVIRHGRRIAVSVFEPDGAEKEAFNLDDYRASLEMKGKSRRHKKGFVMVPETWMQRLTKATRVGTIKLGLRLLYASWKSNGAPIKVSNEMATAAGLGRDPKRRKFRALAELEGFGLIAVERCKKQAPVVTMLLLTD
jgi:hypothetical protein